MPGVRTNRIDIRHPWHHFNICPTGPAPEVAAGSVADQPDWCTGPDITFMPLKLWGASGPHSACGASEPGQPSHLRPGESPLI